MKFFFSQIEMSKEAIRVGTLTLIRAVVSADGEQGWNWTGREAKEAGLTHVWTLVISSFIDPTGWTMESQLPDASYFLPLGLTSTVTHTPHPQSSPQTLNPSFPLSLNSKLVT